MIRRLCTLLCLLGIAGATQASELMIYPNEGQDEAQQEQDNYQCYSWAKNESGFDPMLPPTATEPPPDQKDPNTGVGRGALRGAAVGGIIDGSDGAKTGAAVGAVTGGVRRSTANKQNAQAQAQYEQQQVAQYEAARSSYNRAFAACMEGRGYTVR